MVQELDKHSYTVKNVKIFSSRNGYGMSCSIYKDNKRIGTYLDEGDGSCPKDKFNSKNDEQEFIEVAKAHYPDDRHDFATPFLNELADDWDAEKKAKRNNKKTYYKIAVNDDYQRSKILIINVPKSSTIENALNGKYGKNLIKIF